MTDFDRQLLSWDGWTTNATSKLQGGYTRARKLQRNWNKTETCN